MRKDMGSIKRCLGGYDPRQVNQFIRRMTKLQEEEIEQLQQSISQLESEKEHLSQTLFELKQKSASRSADKQLEQLALERLEPIISAMRRKTEDEERELDLQAERLEQIREDCMEQIKQVNQRFSKVVESLLYDMDSLGEPAPSETELPEEAASASVHETETKETPAKLELKQGRVLHFKKRDLSKNVQTRPEQDESAEPIQLAGAEAAAASIYNDTAVNEGFDGGSFWGSIDSYMIEKPGQEALHTEKAPLAEQLAEEIPVPSQEPAPIQPPEPSPEPLTNEESPAISEEIYAIRYRYIVGKEAGEDLHTRDGKCIVAKNQTITEQMVELADKEGKLPDLIVNMKIPGMGDKE